MVPAGFEMTTVVDGAGDFLAEGDVIEWNYVVKFNDGKLIEDSRDRAMQWKFVVGKGMVIKCVDMALMKMRKGGRAVVRCPPELAFGDSNSRYPAGSTIIYDIEVNDVTRGSE